MSDEKQCPFCGNMIPLNAQKCRFCSHDIVDEQTNAIEHEQKTLFEVQKSTETTKCPFCDGEISPNVRKCKHCGSWVNGFDEHNTQIPKTNVQPATDEPMKICPVCRKRISIGTQKCPYCNEWIEKEKREPSPFYKGAKLVVDIIMILVAVGVGLAVNDWLAGAVMTGIGYIFVALYFLPTVIAGNKGHKQTVAIGVINLFFGVTFIGWVVALIWACMDS